MQVNPNIDWQPFNTRILARVAMSRLGIRVSDLAEFEKAIAQGATVDDLRANIRRYFPTGNDPTNELTLIFNFVAAGLASEDDT